MRLTPQFLRALHLEFFTKPSGVMDWKDRPSEGLYRRGSALARMRASAGGRPYLDLPHISITAYESKKLIWTGCSP